MNTLAYYDNSEILPDDKIGQLGSTFKLFYTYTFNLEDYTQAGSSLAYLDLPENVRLM
jgi:hypothetical protein